MYGLCKILVLLVPNFNSTFHTVPISEESAYMVVAQGETIATRVGFPSGTINELPYFFVLLRFSEQIIT